MSGVQFDIKVNTGGSGSAIDGIVSGLTGATSQANSFNSAVAKIGGAAFAFNNIKSAVSGIADDFNAAIQPGINFNDQMKDLQSITGVTDEQLKKIGDSARASAKTFGLDASAAVESYKLILSQLSPEIGNNSVALAAMGNNAAILSKQLGGDVAGATSILTTAMNQYGVSLTDPMEASRDMALMMNIMSAAAKEGSAELPQIQAAIQNAGLMAKTANVPFNELNAAIQVLDKAGKKGAEGGVAIRNVLAEIGQGSRMPKMAAEALKLYGISTDALGDKNKSFSERLALLKPLMKDTSAMTAIFGKENVAAATALVQGTSEMDRLTTAITGTNTATEMADTKMGSFKEKMARANAQMKDWGISLFNATEGFLPFVHFAGSALSTTANLGMAMSAVGAISETKFGEKIGKASKAVWDFIKSLGTGIVSVVRQGVVMGFNAVVAVGSYIGSLIAATAAQMGLNAAMYANPIGLIVLGIAAAVAAVATLVYWWDEIWGAIKRFAKWVWDNNPFKFIIDIVDKVFPGFKQAMNDLWNWVQKKFTDLIDWFKNAWKSIKGFFGFGGDDEESKQAAVEEIVTKAKANIEVKTVVDDKSLAYHKPDKKDKHSKTSKEMSANISGGGSRPTTVHLTIHKLQDQIVVHTTNLQTGAKEAGRQIVEEILIALNSVNGKASAI